MIFRNGIKHSKKAENCQIALCWRTMTVPRDIYLYTCVCARAYVCGWDMNDGVPFLQYVCMVGISAVQCVCVGCQ